MREIAAGGVVYQQEGDAIRVLLIEDRYGKIALPKGKMEANETVEQTALREIQEETGIVGKIKAPLAQISYEYEAPQRGKIDKVVHYYLVEAVGGTLKRQIEEVRSVAWLTPEAMWDKQLNDGYDNNNDVIEKALAILAAKISDEL